MAGSASGEGGGVPDRSPFVDGASFGIGSLPHRDAPAAAALAIGEFDIATVPLLPNRSPAEGMLARAIHGIAGLSIGDSGDVVVDRRLADADAPVVADLDDDAFGGLRSFLTLAGKVGVDGAPVKWQHVGPVTLGLALCAGGLDGRTSFTLALRAVRTNLAAVSAAVAAALPSSPQLVLLDEPGLGHLQEPAFPLPPDEAIDLISGGMAVLDQTATVGIHCCTDPDLATMLAAGPAVVSVPVSEHLVEWAGYVARFLDDGGVIAWGAVPTDGPVGWSAERRWRALSDVWCGLVRRGCDPVTLRRQSMITPTCGLSGYSVSVARRIARQTGDVARRVKDQAGATRFALGA